MPRPPETVAAYHNISGNRSQREKPLRKIHATAIAGAMMLAAGSGAAESLKAAVMEEGKADLFLTYCTNAVLAQQEVPELQIVVVPAELAVGADYGLIVLDGAPTEAWRLALHILSPSGQVVLAGGTMRAPG